jgi:RNA polymerase sigma-70 factor, ECF subfamily
MALPSRKGGAYLDGVGGHPSHGGGATMSDKLKLLEGEIPRLRRYARYLVRDVDRADDLVQECLTRAVAKIDSWTEGTNLRAWLFVILKNCHINEIRHNQRMVVDNDLSADHQALAMPASQDAHMALREVREAYLTLSEEHREVLLLVAIEGMQYEEAAVVLEVPLGTVRSRLSRARQALRDALGESDSVPPRAHLSLARETRHG